MFDLMPFERKQRGLMNYFDEMEKNLFGDWAGGLGACKTDIIDKGDHYLLQAELPGFQKDDIHVDIEGDYLTISAQQSEDHEEKKDQFVRRERRYGSFSRSFNISGINADAIDASYQNGVLEMKLPKKAPQSSSARKVEIK